MQFCQLSELNVLMLPALHVTNILDRCLVVTLIALAHTSCCHHLDQWQLVLHLTFL